ncbi:hypothetical protein Tco_0380885 [Tanacetum coccineum]
MRKSMLKQEFSEFRVSESEGLHKGYDRFQKILSQLNRCKQAQTMKICNMKFSQALPPSWSQDVIILIQSHSTTFTSASSSPTASSNVMENVLHSFVAESDPQQQITYEDFDQIRKIGFGGIRHQMHNAMLSVRINRFEKKSWDKAERFGETFGSDEVFDPSAPSIFDTTPEDVTEKPLYDRFVKAIGMHAVPPPITRTFMPPSNNPDLDDTQFTYVTSPQTQRPLALLHLVVSSDQVLKLTRHEPLASALISVAFQNKCQRLADQQQVPQYNF